MILYLILLIFAIITLWWCSKLYIFYVRLRNFPGPIPLPVIGNGHFFRNGSDVIKNLLYYQRKYGGMYKIMLGVDSKLIITDHKAAESLLNSTTLLNKANQYKFFWPWIGKGLLTSTAEDWKVQRKLLTPTFHFKILDQFIDVFNRQTDTLVKELEKNLDGNPFNIFPFISSAALDVICETSMGVQINAQINEDSKYVKNVKEISHLISARMFDPLIFNDTIYSFTKNYKKEQEVLSALRGFTNSVIQKRHDELCNLNKDTEVHSEHRSDDIGEKKKIAFLDLMLQCTMNNEHLSDEFIRNQVDTFMFAGHDTVTTGISFTLYCLGQNQDIQEKAVEELRTIFSDDKSRKATHQDLQNMKYLDMVIKEAMRLYPPVTTFMRGLTEEVELYGEKLPAGIDLFVFVHGIHRQPDIYPDPEKFDPERFSVENSSKRPIYAYLPFSAGSRNCIGYRYAYLIMKSAVCAILRNYYVLPVENFTPELVFDLVLHSTNGVMLKVKKRKF